MRGERVLAGHGPRAGCSSRRTAAVQERKAVHHRIVCSAGRCTSQGGGKCVQWPPTFFGEEQRDDCGRAILQSLSRCTGTGNRARRPVSAPRIFAVPPPPPPASVIERCVNNFTERHRRRRRNVRRERWRRRGNRRPNEGNVQPSCSPGVVVAHGGWFRPRPRSNSGAIARVVG